MLFSVQDIISWSTQTKMPYGSWVPARPVWTAMSRWKHAWWVLIGRCDAIWWPEDGNPHRTSVGKS